MASPTRSSSSPIATRVTAIIQNTTVISPRSVSTRSQLEESISTLQNEQERVQKKTFTKWVNIYLSLHEPPYFVNDLFEDFRDGIKLIALLEVLSGQTLPMERGKKRAHCLSNVDNALKYLESRKIKLVNIRPIDIVDGKPMMILGLIWMLILGYQIEDSNMFDEDSKDNRSKAKEALLEWVRKKTTGFHSSTDSLRQIDSLNVRDFTTSWRDGLAFNALIHAIRPDLVDLRRVTHMPVRERLENAFDVAEQHLGIPRLIDAEDVDVNKPDEKSIMTYVAQFSRRFPDLPFGSINKEHGELLRWLGDTRQRLTLVIEAPIQDIAAEYKEYVKQQKEYAEKTKSWKAFERKESKSPHFPGEKLKELKDLFEEIANRMNRWRFKLDSNLPGELRQIADWINTAEGVLSRGINFDPSQLSPEENVQRFHRLHEEHIGVFADKEIILTSFQRIKRDQSVLVKQIAIEHLTNLNERLDEIQRKSNERGCYLDFQVLYWKVQVHFLQLEYFINALNTKQGDINQTEKLYNEYKRKVHDEKILSIIESFLPELTRKAQQYSQIVKKDDPRAKEFLGLCENIRRTVKEFSVDLMKKEQMLQDTINSWKIYHNLYDSFEKWLQDGEHVLRRSSEEKLNFFSNIEHSTETYEKLRVAIERLISVCDEAFTQILQNKLLFINRRWKEIIESVQQFKLDESIKKKRDEFYAGRAKVLDTLDKIDREMQQNLPCTAKALKEQENRLYDAQAELDMFNQTIQVLSKLSQAIARESGESNASMEMNSLLQICFDKLRHVQENLPITLKRNRLILGHLQKFEDCLQKCHQWFHEARQLMNRYSIQVPVKRIEEFLEQHRNFFSEIGYYRSLIDNQAKLILTMKKSNENLVLLNYSPIDEQYKQLLDTYEQINQQVSYWEKEFTQHSQLWKDFHQRLKHLEQWIEQAQNIVNEKHDDYAYLIQKHKNFFQTVDDEILHGFIRSGRELLHIRDRNEQKDIQQLMDTLESKWNTIIIFAPIRLLRLQYERIENIIVKELKQAEDELNDELRQLERQRDTTDILRRHNEHFQSNNFQPTIETHIKSLQTYANDIRTKESNTNNIDNDQIDQRTNKLNDYWLKMQTKIENVKRKLQTIPKQWQEFEEKFHLVQTWITNIERSIRDTENTECSFDQYKIIVNKFKSDVQQIDTMAAHVKTISSILDNLIEERATDDPAQHRQRLDTLLSHYRHLLQIIDETSQRCGVLVPAKMIHENILQISTSLTNISNSPIHFRDLSDVRTALQGQTRVCEVLENLSQQVNELITRGNDLLKQPFVPKYVQHDVQMIQRLYNDKVQSAQEYLTNLKRVLELWEHFDANKRRYYQQIERLNNELTQLNSNRTSIGSFQHEIDNCKHLRTSYHELRAILDENTQHLQTISANHLLPYENLQSLNHTNENMSEEFNEKLRMIDEILQDLNHDNEKWTHFNDELKRLEALFREIGSMFDAKMFGERSIEEKQQILERVRSELGEHLHSLSILYTDGSNLESLRCRPKDLPNMLNRLTQLRTLAETTSGKVNREEEQVVVCRTHVQISQRYIQQLQPWIEEAENYLTKRVDQTGALNLTEAKTLYDKHKDFLEKRRRMLPIYNSLLDEESKITDQHELKSLIKSLQTRWSEIFRKSDELTPKYDKQYSSWLLFESELNSFRDQILSELEQRVNALVSMDFKKIFDLNQINTLLNELRSLDENIHSHTTNYNRFHKQLNDLRQYTSPEGQRILYEEQMLIETRWHHVNRITTDKLRDIERLYESRKAFHNRFEVFERSVRDISEQIENNSQIITGSLNQTIQRLQQAQKQLHTVQALVPTIEDELTDFELAGLSKPDLQTLLNTFDSYRQRMITYEIILQKRLDLLKRYEEHMKYSTEIKIKLQEINDDIQKQQKMKVHEVDLIKSQLDRYAHDLRILYSESSILDRLMEESNTTIIESITNRNIFFLVEYRTIQNLVDTIENKLIQRRLHAQELERLVDDFTQAHTNLLSRLNSLSNNLRTARLIGYSPREIEDLMVIVKTLHRDIQGEEIHLNTLRSKYKSLSSDLSDDEQKQSNEIIKKIEIEFEQLQDQISKRKERLSILISQRQELDQISNRFTIWYDDKQRLLSSDSTIPLKTSEIERIHKKYNDTLNELKTYRITLDTIVKLVEQIKQGYTYENRTEYDFPIDELIRKLNHFDEELCDRNQRLTLACEQRRDFDRIISKLQELIKSLEQQIKEPLTNDLQQTANHIKDKSKAIQILLQSTKDRSNEFNELTRIHAIISSTLNENDRITLEEKYTIVKDKYNRLLDSLTQRIALLDEAYHERNQFDQEHQYIQDVYQRLQNEFNKQKQQTINDNTLNEQRFEEFKQLSKTLDDINNRFKELSRIQRLLIGKGHRIDFRSAGELNINLKTFDGQIHNEIERIEKILQIERDFNQLEKEIDSYLQTSSEQLKSSPYHQDKDIIYQTVSDRLQQVEHDLNKLVHFSERLQNDLPRTKYEQLKRTIEQRQERLQILNKTCQQERYEHEHLLKTQHKLNEDLISINDWFRKLIHDLTQPLQFNLSLNNLQDFQHSLNQLSASIDQRLARVEQILRDEPNLINSNDGEIRERLNAVNELKHQVKSQLNKQRIIVDDIHQHMTEYFKITAEVKTAICDIDLKLAPYFDGYDRNRLDEYEKDLDLLEQICSEQNFRLVEAHKHVENIRSYLKVNAKELSDNQLRNFHQTIEELETRIEQRHKEIDEIRQKINRFNISAEHLQSDIERILEMLGKSPESIENLLTEMESTFTALQYLGRDLKRSFDVTSAMDIDRKLKELTHTVENVHENLDRARKSQEENETLRERIERILDKLNVQINRKQQELQEFIDHNYENIDSGRRLIEMKNFLKDIDLHNSQLIDVNQLLKMLIEKTYDLQIIRLLEKKQENIVHDLQTLKTETIRIIENFDQQTQEQDKLRQNIRNLLSILQRTKVNLIEIRPTMNDDGNQKIKKIEDDLIKQFHHFEQTFDNYKTNYGTLSEDLDKMISRIYEDMENMKSRFNEKRTEFNNFTILKNDYDVCLNKISKIIQTIETKLHQSNVKLNIDLLKDLMNEIQANRSLVDRSQVLSSTLISQLLDSNEREQIRRRLNEIIRRWTEIEQNLINEEEDVTELTQIHQQYTNLHSSCERWLNQTKDLINELANARTMDVFDQLMPKAKIFLSEYHSNYEHLQRLRTRLNRIIQNNKTTDATQRLNDIDRLINDLQTVRDNLERRLDSSQKIYFQLNEFNKQYIFYDQWIENLNRTIETLSDQTLTIDENLQRIQHMQNDLDKRKQILSNINNDYPQINQFVTKNVQKLISNIERIKTNLNRKQEDYEQQKQQHKDIRKRMETLFEWIKESFRYEPLNSKRDLESLQREQTRLNERKQQIFEKSKEIDSILRNINSSKLSNDSVQRLKQELDHLKERFHEIENEIETRTKLIKNSMRDIDEYQRKQRSYQESLNKFSSLNNQDVPTSGRSVEDALKSLDDQMNKFEIQTDERERRRREREREWHSFFDEITLLQDKINVLKQRKSFNEHSIEDQIYFTINQIQELDEYENELINLKQYGQMMSIEDGNSIPLPSEIYLLQSMINFLKQQYEQSRKNLIELLNNRDVYLNEHKSYEDLYNLVLERLSNSPSLSSNIDEYECLLNEYIHFNKQINDKHEQLNILYDQLDRQTRTRFSNQHNDIEKSSNDLQYKLVQRISHFEYLLRLSKEHQLRYNDLCQQIDDIQKQLINNKQLIDYQQIPSTFSLYKNFKQRLTIIEPELYHLNDEIQTFLQEINIDFLQNQMQSLKETYYRIMNDVQDKLICHKNASSLVSDIKRNFSILETILEQCSTEIRLQQTNDINQLKIQLEQLLDIEKRLEHIQDTYSNTMTLIKRLKTYNLYDLETITNNLDMFHQKSEALKINILRDKSLLQQNIISNLPSRQAYKDLSTFIDTMKRLLDDDHRLSIDNKETLQKLLKRYREMRIDVFNHQMTMDFLNESFQKESDVELTSIEYLENIKQINIDWIRIKSLILARNDTLEQLNEQLNDFDHTIRTLSEWVQEQTSDLEFMRTRNLEAGAKNNLRRCNEIEYQLTTKQKILTSLKSSNNRMLSYSTVFHITDQDDTIEDLRHMIDHLSPLIEQLKLKSNTILNDWQEYNRVSKQMEKILRESQAEINRIETSTLNVETYEMCIRKAQEHLKLMESHRNDFDKIPNHSRQLSGQCDTEISSKINEITQRIQQQWTIVEQRLKEIIKPSRDIIDNWRQFNSSYVHLLDRLSELEGRWHGIQRERFTSDVDTLSDKSKDFQERLQQLDSEIIKLHERTLKLNNNLPSIAIKKLDTQYSVIKNQYTQLENFQRKLINDCNELKHREKLYHDYLNELVRIIKHVQTTLQSQELNDENEHINLKQLNELENLLETKRQLIEHLNSNEFLFYIKRTKRLHEILIEYSNCSDLIKNRLKQIELNEYNRLNFDKRCQKWNEYINAIEQNLAVVEENFQTNYHGFIEIERNLLNTINDFNQRQQELIKLINEGKQILENQNIFIRLEQRWKKIMNAVLKKHEQVKELIQLWVSYQNYLESYHRLLKGKCQIEERELQTATINVINEIKQGLHKPTIENDELKDLFEKIQDINRRLMNYSDTKTRNSLEKELNDLQKSKQDIQMNIKQKCDTLISNKNIPRKEKLLLRYNELDRKLDEMSSFIKSTRSLQQQSKDDFDLFLQQCQNKNRELTQYKTELQHVRHAITEISAELHSEDTRQLIQKLNLLEIQWNDAERVLATLVDSFTRRRTEYQEFENKFIRFTQWFEDFLHNEMGRRLDSLSLQSSLEILKTDIKNTIIEKRKYVNELLIQARLLQSKSNDQTQIQALKQRNDQLEQIISTAEQHIEKRIRKIELILKMIDDFDKGFDNISLWFDKIHNDLQQSTTKTTSNQLAFSSIDIDIEKHSTVINSLLALGHNLLNEHDIRPRNIDSLSNRVQTIEHRWTTLKELLNKQKHQFDNTQTSTRNIEDAIRHGLKIIIDHEQFLHEIKRTGGDGLSGIRNEYKTLETFRRTLDIDDKQIQKINDKYSEIIRLQPNADGNDEIRQRIKELTNRWDALNATVHETMKNLKYMLSVYGDFELTQSSLALWLTDLDAVLTNLQHLSEAPIPEKLQQLDDIDREIKEKQSKIDYVQTCANYLLEKTVDATGLKINVNELSKLCQQLKQIGKRVRKMKQSFSNLNERHTELTIRSRSPPSPSRSRSPPRRHRSFSNYIRLRDTTEFDNRRERANELLADYEDIILQVNADLRSKEESLHSSTPFGVQIENLPIEFSYNRVLLSTRRKIDALYELIRQIKVELQPFLIEDLSNDAAVLDISSKWIHLQNLANDKDDELNENRQEWKNFKRQLDKIEQIAQQFTNIDYLSSRTPHSKSDVHQSFDEFQVLLKSIIDLSIRFNDGSSEWLLIEHRLQVIKDKFQFLFTKPTRPTKANNDMKQEIFEITSQLDHLESLTHSLEPIDNNETNQNITRTKLHRFIRIHDDLEILNERLIHISGNSLMNDHSRTKHDIQLVFDRLNSVKHIVKIYLDQLEILLSKTESNQTFSLTRRSSLRSSNNNLQRIYQ